MKNRIQMGLIIILIIFALSLILSQKANPDIPPLFTLKRLQEKAFFKLKSSPLSKGAYLESLLEVRLEELENLVDSRSYNYILSSSLRYSATAGELTNLVVSNNLKGEMDHLKNIFSKHQKRLLYLTDKYPKDIPGNEEWKYIQDDFNYLGLYLDQLSKVK